MPRPLVLAMAALVALGGAAPLRSLAAQCVPAIQPLDGELPLHLAIAQACSETRRSLPTFELLLSQRSGLPDGRGNGAAPAGLGQSLQLRAALTLRFDAPRVGALVLRLAPELHQVANRNFLTFPSGDSTRSGYASPFYFGQYSADLPSRPGSEIFTRATFGESGIWLTSTQSERALQWSVGATTALPHWGPGVGEGLVLGRSSEGLPRIEARASVNGRASVAWFAGAAVESRFFDADPDNNLRGVAGLRLQYGGGSASSSASSSASLQWQVGVARTLMDGRHDRAPLAAALRPFTRGSDAARDSTIEMLSADLRLHWPSAGATVWLEAARQAPLQSLRDVFLLPTEGLAIRVGSSLPIVQRDALRWQLGFEALRTDQPPQRADRIAQDFYTSPTVVQGWTHRGESLGSGVGPGGQRQLLSLDRETPQLSLGGFIERIRYNEDALYRQFLPYPLRHDASLQLGLRGARERDGWRYGITLLGGQRLNYLFQNGEWIPGYRTDDETFLQLSLSVGPTRR